MSDFNFDFQAAGIFPGGVFLFRGDATGCRAKTGMGLSCCRRRENRRRKNRAMVIRQETDPPPRDLSQEGMLKTELKVGWRTGASWEYRPQMFGGLQQRLGLAAGRRRLLAAEPGAQAIQLPAQLASQPIERFQHKGQPQLFSRSLERKASQHLHQPLPHQRGGQSVSR